ncbi:MAG: ATP-binding cassette domain-containing protein [Defluviitaleaceae bacterium]|nr:ATP-binding cassette domain-containing protein [Defluviitaleaceae bacterium]
MFDLAIKRAFYGENTVLTDFQLTAQKGENIFICGPSGIGKSTILKIIGGLHKQYDGTLNFAHENVRISYVPQTVGLLPWKNVLSNITILKKSEPNKTRKVDINKAQNLLQTLGLADFAKRYPHQLSGGQRSRVALGQALFYEPEIILLDEPFSALDYDTKIATLQLTREILHGSNITTVLVSHADYEADFLDCRVVRVAKQ